MKSRALERKILACMAALLVAAVPLLDSSCRSDLLPPPDAGTSQQSSTPTVTAVVPASGPLSGGTVVTISGANFTSDTQATAPSVSFGGTPATKVTVVSSSQLKAHVPAHAAGRVAVQIVTSDGESASLPNAFTYKRATISVNSVSPNSGDTAGGTVVTITGSDFASGATVTFGGASAAKIAFVSSSQLKATTPAHASGSVNVGVTNPGGGNAVLTGGFTFGTATFSVKSVSPFSGPAAGGTAVTISGSGFQSGVSVTFGGLAASTVKLTNSSTITAVTPVHSSGSVTVTVTNSSGDSATLPSGYRFHSIDLLWNAPSSSPTTIAGYNVYRGSTSAGPFGRLNGSSPLATTSFIDATVEGSTTYYYEVKSVDPSGVESPPAGPVPATTSP